MIRKECIQVGNIGEPQMCLDEEIGIFNFY